MAGVKVGAQKISIQVEQLVVSKEPTTIEIKGAYIKEINLVEAVMQIDPIQVPSSFKITTPTLINP